MKLLKLGISALLCFIQFYSNSQTTKDVEAWQNITIEKRIQKKHALTYKQGLRVRNNAQTLKQLFHQFQYTYKLKKWLSFSSTYRYANKWNLQQVFKRVHRAQIQVDFRKKLYKKWRLEQTLKIQQTYNRTYTSQENYLQERYLRTRTRLRYQPSKKVTLKGGVAFFMRINQQYLIDRIRFSLEGRYKLTKHHSFTIGLLKQQEQLSPLFNQKNIVTLSYKYAIK